MRNPAKGIVQKRVPSAHRPDFGEMVQKSPVHTGALFPVLVGLECTGVPGQRGGDLQDGAKGPCAPSGRCRIISFYMCMKNLGHLNLLPRGLCKGTSLQKEGGHHQTPCTRRRDLIGTFLAPREFGRRGTTLFPQIGQKHVLLVQRIGPFSGGWCVLLDLQN